MFYYKGGDIFLVENGNGDKCVFLFVYRFVQVVSNVGDFWYSYYGDMDFLIFNIFFLYGIIIDWFY